MTLLLAILVLLGPLSLSAQEYFGQNYYDEEKPAVEQAGRMAERWYARLSRVLNHPTRTERKHS